MGNEFDDATEVGLPPTVEVDLVFFDDNNMPPAGPWHSFEVWTHNHIYACDWAMRCISVRRSDDDGEVEDHPFLGFRLAGGQKRGGDDAEITHPLPRPGCAAVFERPEHRSFHLTSTVQRVLLRLRVLNVPDRNRENTWKSISKATQRLGVLPES